MTRGATAPVASAGTGLIVTLLPSALCCLQVRRRNVEPQGCFVTTAAMLLHPDLYPHPTPTPLCCVDYAAGFGGRYGVQADRVDQSAVGFDYQGKTEKHESQKGWSPLPATQHPPPPDTHTLTLHPDISRYFLVFLHSFSCSCDVCVSVSSAGGAVPLRVGRRRVLLLHSFPPDAQIFWLVSASCRLQCGCIVSLCPFHHFLSSPWTSLSRSSALTSSDYTKGFGGKFGVETDKVDKSAVGFEYQGKTERHESQKGRCEWPPEL